MYTAIELRLVHVWIAVILLAVSLLFTVFGVWCVALAWRSPDIVVGLWAVVIGVIFAGGGWMCVRCARKKEHS